MALHFTPEEFADRQSRAARAVADVGLEAILLFAPESHYWLTGYDTFGFAMFQCMVLTAGGDIALLTRPPDRLQALETSVLTEGQIHLWVDRAGVAPAEELKWLVSAMGVRGRIGIETRTAGLTHANGRAVEAAMGELVEASDLMPALRRVKSPAEIAHIRRAAELSDDALDAAIATARPGAFEGDILAAMQGAVFRGGGGYAGNEFILGSGSTALLCRSHAGRRHLDATDQLTLEWAGTHARYHAAMMQTLVIGTPSDAQRAMHAAAQEALEACEAAIRPGRPMSEVYDAHARAFDAHGFQHARMKACGYPMGAIFAPIWVEFPMFYEGNALEMQENQVFFLHMILMDDTAGLAMCLGHSVLVGANGIERLSRHAPDLISL